MEKKKNGCKAFLISKNRILRSVVTLLLLVSFLFLDVVRVAAASTLEEEIDVKDDSIGTLDITDDDFTNGALHLETSVGFNTFKKTFFLTYDNFINPFTKTDYDIIEPDVNSTIDSLQEAYFRMDFELDNSGRLFTQGSDINFSISNFLNVIDFYDSSGAFVSSSRLDYSRVYSIRAYFWGIDGSNYQVMYLSDFDIYEVNNYLTTSFIIENVPVDTYRFAFDLCFYPSTGFSNSSCFGNSNYSARVYSKFSNSIINFTQVYPDVTDDLLGAINSNLDDIWARLCAIYDMVEDGFSAIVTLFYDLFDFLDAEFDSLSQTIVSQAMETRNAVVAQFTNLTNNLSSWFSNLTSTITNQFTALTTNLRTWYNGLTATLNNNFQSLLDQNAEEHEETINGYDDAVGSNKNEEVSGSINDFNTSQGEIMDDMNENMDDFTLPSDGLIGYAMQFTTTFPLVAGMMQSVFDSSGQFGLILSVIFAMTIFAMIVGMYKYYND